MGKAGPCSIWIPVWVGVNHKKKKKKPNQWLGEKKYVYEPKCYGIIGVGVPNSAWQRKGHLSFKWLWNLRRVVPEHDALSRISYL